MVLGAVPGSVPPSPPPPPPLPDSFLAGLAEMLAAPAAAGRAAQQSSPLSPASYLYQYNNQHQHQHHQHHPAIAAPGGILLAGDGPAPMLPVGAAAAAAMAAAVAGGGAGAGAGGGAGAGAGGVGGVGGVGGGLVGPPGPQTYAVSHPYFPQDARVPGYVPNLTPLPALLLSFAAIAAIVVYTALSLAEDAAPWLRHSRRDRVVFCWFVLCGFLHCFFEGYFVINHASIPGSQGLFAQLWKEYALSDSRYMRSDPFMLCIESITALVWGPLCFTIAACIARRHKLRQLLQAVMCTGHLFGLALYFGTCYFEYRFDGVSHSRPEFLYFWVYYIGFNVPWAVVPAVLLVDSAKAIYRSVKVVESIERLLREGARVHHEIKKFK